MAALVEERARGWDLPVVRDATGVSVRIAGKAPGRTLARPGQGSTVRKLKAASNRIAQTPRSVTPAASKVSISFKSRT
ncbi:MAG TPA: hypothetical protein P5319_09165, partial [Gemmatimonadales bacterium]|nr:hypothetical protein [Gemmatimonadales bacterium]